MLKTLQFIVASRSRTVNVAIYAISPFIVYAVFLAAVLVWRDLTNSGPKLDPNAIALLAGALTALGIFPSFVRTLRQYHRIANSK